MMCYVFITRRNGIFYLGAAALARDGRPTGRPPLRAVDRSAAENERQTADDGLRLTRVGGRVARSSSDRWALRSRDGRVRVVTPPAAAA